VQACKHETLATPIINMGPCFNVQIVLELCNYVNVILMHNYHPFAQPCYIEKVKDYYYHATYPHSNFRLIVNVHCT
jgi:hypothetical protein